VASCLLRRVPCTSFTLSCALSHGNIDDSHLLLFANGAVKLCGFGSAAPLARSDVATSTLSGGMSSFGAASARQRERERKTRTLSLGAPALQQQQQRSAVLPRTANWTLASDDVCALGVLAVALVGRGAVASGALTKFEQLCCTNTVAMSSISDVLDSEWLRNADARGRARPRAAARRRCIVLVLVLLVIVDRVRRRRAAHRARGGDSQRRRAAAPLFRMAPFEDAFDGQQAVDWMCAALGKSSREVALAELQTLQFRGVLRHVLYAGDMHDSTTHIYQLVPTAQRAPTNRELRVLVQRICDGDTRIVAVRPARAAARRRQLLQPARSCSTGCAAMRRRT
jgi:hypothetical protein